MTISRRAVNNNNQILQKKRKVREERVVVYCKSDIKKERRENYGKIYYGIFDVSFFPKFL